MPVSLMRHQPHWTRTKLEASCLCRSDQLFDLSLAAAVHAPKIDFVVFSARAIDATRNPIDRRNVHFGLFTILLFCYRCDGSVHVAHGPVADLR